MSKSADVYAAVADKILEALEQGVRPWESVFKDGLGGFPVRVTGDQYQGINRFLLGMEMSERGYHHPLFMTFSQAKKLGGKVRKGEKASLSVFYKKLEVEDRNDSDKTVSIPMLKRNMVFNVAQIDGLSDELLAKYQIEQPDNSENAIIQRAEKFVQAVPAKVIESNQTPHFSPSKDHVSMPNINTFISSEVFYAVYLHELSHWAGGKPRLDRTTAEWSKENYAREELVAEITAAFLCPIIGLTPRIHEQHAPYLASYIKVIKDDPKAFFKACSQAEKSADYLRSFSEEKEALEAA